MLIEQSRWLGILYVRASFDLLENSEMDTVIRSQKLSSLLNTLAFEFKPSFIFHISQGV